MESMVLSTVNERKGLPIGKHCMYFERQFYYTSKKSLLISKSTLSYWKRFMIIRKTMFMYVNCTNHLRHKNLSSLRD